MLSQPAEVAQNAALHVESFAVGTAFWSMLTVEKIRPYFSLPFLPALSG
jgi:hypothetical protein